MKASSRSATAHASQLGEREQRRRDRSSRMNGGRNVGVIEIEHVGADAAFRKAALSASRRSLAADDGRLPAIGEGGQRLQTRSRPARAAARQRHGEEIHQRAFGLMAEWLAECRSSRCPTRKRARSCVTPGLCSMEGPGCLGRAILARTRVCEIRVHAAARIPRDLGDTFRWRVPQHPPSPRLRRALRPLLRLSPARG